MMLPTEKRCPTCGETKPREAFGLRSNGRWLRSLCLACEAVKGRIYREANPDRWREYNRVASLRMRGLDEVSFAALLAAQDGGCAICGCDHPRQKTRDRLFVDHDHETGVRRGLLCSGCNVGLARFGDDPARLIRAALYLIEHAKRQAESAAS